ncbi:MAG TPA: hypothetical protein VMT80_02530 [Candidatus Paceibacterota bacterium]|nr:hypothetical protein [Candidatus Paceibacterota bacterium]
MLEEIHKSFVELRDVLAQVLRYPNMKMNMKAHKDSSVIVFAALALVIVFAGAWLYMASPSAPSSSVATSTPDGASGNAATTTGTHTGGTTHPSGGTTATPPSPKAKFAGVGSLNYLVSVKEDLTCNIETTSGSLRRVGTIFISGNKLRGDFSSYFNGATRTSHMIDDGTNLFVWVNGYDSGLKLPAANGASGSAAANAGGIDPTVNVAFACYPWTVDSSIFSKPSDVTFTDSFGH